MSDVNEELVRRYYELQGYFVRTNVRYAFSTEKGMGWSDIDLCVLHPGTGDAAAVEIKGWHTSVLSARTFETEPSLFHFVRPEAQTAAEKIFARKDFRRVLVVGQLAKRTREQSIAYANGRNVEVLEFSDVLRYLVENTKTNMDAGSESEHVIRVLKVYGFLSEMTPGTQ